MQPRFTPPNGLPPAPGAPPGRPMFQPPPQFVPPGALPPPHGMMPGVPMGMHPGMAMGMPGHGMHMHPGQPMMPPQYPFQPQHMPPAMPPAFPPARPAQSVIVGAPTIRAPVPAAPLPQTPAPTVVISATSAIHDFNFSNPAAVFMNATSSQLNKTIFTNSAAALPVTLYIGHVPLDMTDQTLMRALEVCGKIFKFTRPVDPSTSLPAAFALVTYSQALCGVRCLNTLHNYVLDAVECSALVVRAGKKETVQLESIVNTEQEAGAQLPEGYSLEEGIYGPIRAAVDAVFASASGVAAVGAADSSVGAVGSGGVNSVVDNVTYVPAVGDSAEAGELTEETTTNPANPGATTDTTNYSALDTIDNFVNASNNNASGGDEQVVDEAGEKQLMSEIEQFRLRQLQRDKDVEAQRKIKIQQKMQELKAMQKIKAEREARALADGLTAPIPTTAPPSSSIRGSESYNRVEEAAATNKRSVVELSAEELEAKRQRKLEVLQMLSGGTAIDTTADATLTPSASTTNLYTEPTTTTTDTAIVETTGASTFPTTTNTNTNMKLSIKNKLPSTASKTTFAAQDDDEHAPVREIVKLDYTAEELSSMHSSSASYNTMYVDDYHDDGDFGSVKKRAAGAGAGGVLGAGLAAPAAPLDMSTLQALALAKAQALSLALKSSTAAQSASVSAPVGAGADGKTEAEKLKSLVDKIPTGRNELFAYPLQWSVLERNNIVQDVMSTWVGKKILEFLGEEEPSLVEFIIGKLQARCSAEDLLEELSVVLDDAAEPFVLKLWRMLVYYSVKN